MLPGILSLQFQGLVQNMILALSDTLTLLLILDLGWACEPRHTGERGLFISMDGRTPDCSKAAGSLTQPACSNSY